MDCYGGFSAASPPLQADTFSDLLARRDRRLEIFGGTCVSELAPYVEAELAEFGAKAFVDQFRERPIDPVQSLVRRTLP
ncbi:MAG TPA: hypothetical protein VK638_55715 [Edaphobacter sp.]|nr:hypothetical protein [Edaphobacter sp.]